LKTLDQVRNATTTIITLSKIARIAVEKTTNDITKIN
jgi:hypothetical protein